LTAKCGQIESCFLVDAETQTEKVLLVSGEVKTVAPGEYIVECTTTGGMCLLDFQGLATQGCDETTEQKHCNDQPICDNWSSRRGNKFRIEPCGAKSITVTGKIWMQADACDKETFQVVGECPSPVDDCQIVDFACAKCGQVLECYVDAPLGSDAYGSTEKHIQSTAFCDGFKTKFGGQQCAMKQGLQVYHVSSIHTTCPVLGEFQCRAGAGGGKGAGLSNWATYQYNSCESILHGSEKCDSGKTCGCEFGANVFCASC
jgi:hypothetical protein